MHQLIDREIYPELNLILWDHPDRFVEPAFAFHKYEDRWRYVDPNHLTEIEQKLIATLTQTIGNGHFLPA